MRLIIRISGEKVWLASENLRKKIAADGQCHPYWPEIFGSKTPIFSFKRRIVRCVHLRQVTTALIHSLPVSDLEEAEPAPPPFGQRTDVVTHGHISYNAKFLSFYRNTWYSEYSK